MRIGDARRGLAVLARHPAWVLCVIGIVHRTVLFFSLRGTLMALAAQRPRITVVQLYPLEIYRDHFWSGLWLLQQTPPIPHLIARIVLMLASWPLGVAQCLCAMNGCISIVTACLLQRTIHRLSGSAAAGFVMALWFLLSTDLVVLEYVFFGQEFYENVGMCLVTACCALLPIVYGHRAGRRHAAALGVLAALAALTRSSLSFLALVPALLLLGGGRRRLLVAYLAPVLLLQGGWALKNRIVFGHFAWETSTWGGVSAAHGLGMVIGQQPLCDTVLASGPGVYPGWFIKTARDCPQPFFAIFDNDMPAAVQAQDASARARLGNHDPLLNSLAARLRSNEYRRAVVQFIVANPRIYAERFAVAYNLLWQRMGDYGARFWAPFYVEPRRRALLDVGSRGFGERQRAMITRPDFAFVAFTPTSEPIFLPTISLAPLDALSIVVLHIVFPLLAVADLWRRWRGRSPRLSMPLWAIASVVGYGLFMFTAVELSENMRFRLAIEPAILALTAACLVIVLRASVGLARRASSLREPITPPLAATP